VETETEEQR